MIRLTLLVHGGDTIGTMMKRRFERSNRTVAFTDVRKPVVFWNMTSRCNLSCSHCYIDAGAPQANELSTAEATAFMEDLAKMKVPLLMFTGGEPFLRPDLLKLASNAHDLGLRTAISTNGTMITKEKASMLKSFGVEYVGVSLDGATRETHDHIRGDGSFAKAIDGLKVCVGSGLACGSGSLRRRTTLMRSQRCWTLPKS